MRQRERSELCSVVEQLWTGTAIKHLAGQHNQKRHGWRYSSGIIATHGDAVREQMMRRAQSAEQAARIVAARRSMRLTPEESERAEYRRRSELPQDIPRISRRAGEAPSPASPPLSPPPPASEGKLRITSSEASENGDAFIDYFEERGISVYPASAGKGIVKAAKTSGIKDVAGMAYEAYNLKSGDYEAQLNEVEFSGNIASFRGNIYYKREQVGRFSRSVVMLGDGNNYVTHDFLEIEESYQNSGFGSEFYRHTEQAYIRAGIKRIYLEANLTVGGYAWARMGFDFADPREQRRFSDLAKLSYWMHTGKRYDGSLNHAWEIAALTVDGRRVGKDILLGEKWSGYKDLNPSSTGFIIGEEYYARKLKK